MTTIAAQDVPDKARSGMDAWQVHMVLLPYKKQRKKTSVQKGSLPHFNETFHFSGLHPSELHKLAVRFRLYALGGRVLRDRLIGEKVLRLDELQPGGGTTEMTLSLEPRSDLKVSLRVAEPRLQKADGSPVLGQALDPQQSSMQALAHGGVPELLLGLSYNATTGRLSVEAVKGSHFRNLAVSRPPGVPGTAGPGGCWGAGMADLSAPLCLQTPTPGCPCSTLSVRRRPGARRRCVAASPTPSTKRPSSSRWRSSSSPTSRCSSPSTTAAA